MCQLPGDLDASGFHAEEHGTYELEDCRMLFKFDEEIDKSGMHNSKWEFRPVFGKQHEGVQIYGDHAHPKHGANRILPMWVADMDFSSPPVVVEAVMDWASKGVYGYSSPADSYFEAVIDWVARRYGRAIERDWIVNTPGVMPAVNMLIQTFIRPGDKVLVQRPVYYPFFDAIKNNGAEIVSNALILENGRYQMDFEDLAAKAADPAVKMAVLCSPHNPIGRVWQPAELARFGEICQANNVLVVSDEVHCDLIYEGHEFTTFANINEQFAQESIVCFSPSKTFNLAGLKTSTIIIPAEEIRIPFQKTIARNGLRGVNPVGIVATEAAYRQGEAWLTAVIAYIEANYQFMVRFLAEHLPQLRVIAPQGTYLAWVDCRALEMELKERKMFFTNQVKLLLDEGELFGPEGEGFERFNLACPRSILVEALERLKTAVAAS